MPSDTHLGVLTKWLTKGKCSGIVYLARALYNKKEQTDEYHTGTAKA